MNGEHATADHGRGVLSSLGSMIGVVDRRCGDPELDSVAVPVWLLSF